MKGKKSTPFCRIYYTIYNIKIFQNDTVIVPIAIADDICAPMLDDA